MRKMVLETLPASMLLVAISCIVFSFSFSLKAKLWDLVGDLLTDSQVCIELLLFIGDTLGLPLA